MSFAFLAHPPSLSQLNTKSSKLNIRSSILPPSKTAKPTSTSDQDYFQVQTPSRRPSIRRRSATVSGTVCNITNWATQIVPGSPAPLTPRTPRTPPLSAIAERLWSASSPHVVQHKRRRSSVSNSGAAAINFLNLLDTPSTARISVCTPSPSYFDNKPTSPSVAVDLQAQGYTTVFVRLPGTPLTPHTAPPQSSGVIPSLKVENSNKIPPVPAIPKSPKSPSSKKTFTRLRALSFKSAKKSTMFTQHQSTSSSKHATSMAVSSKPKSTRKKSASSSSTPQARYGHLLAPAGGAGALPLAQEVQLSQMLDGGSVDANVKRVAKRHAKDTGAAVSSKKPKSREDAPGNGVTGVYRDGRGGMFWDEAEAFELAGLLKRTPTSPSTPGGGEQPQQAKRSALRLGGVLKSQKPKSANTSDSAPSVPADWVDPTRRGSESAASEASTTRSSSVGSELGFAVRPLSGAGSSAPVAGFVPGYSIGMGASAATSMRADDAFIVPRDELTSPLDKKASRERPRARRRPTPLTLTTLPAPSAPPPAAPVKSAPARHTRMQTAPPLPSMPGGIRAREVEEGRKDFFASSFDPPVPVPLTATAPARDKEQQHVQQRPPLSSQPSKSASGRRLSFTMTIGNVINSTARTVRRASTSLGVPSPGPLTAVTDKFNNAGSSANASTTQLHSLAYGNGSTKSRASSTSSKTIAPSPPPLRLKVSKLKLSSLFHRSDKSSKNN